jgi:putative iron-regulated protein
MLNSICRLLAGTALTAMLAVPVVAAEPKAVVETYADIAEAMYGDALAGTQDLQKAVDALIAKPSEEALVAARKAWLESRPWYQRTEAFRFGNASVDAWEGRVNAWPLDEGLIDYVDSGSYGETSDENPLFRANIIGSRSIRIGKDEIDVSVITKELLRDKLHEAAGVESNVATGYHAIEFLLWGQDLNGTGPGAGARRSTDFDPANCTNGNCDRRAQYLKVATDLLVDDLTEMADAWKVDGPARKELLDKGESGGLATIVTGIGSLSYGELAGERMKLGVLLHDPEEEHDCFSDNTHNSHYYDQAGMIAIANGVYQKRDGTKLEGPGLMALATAKGEAEAKALAAAMSEAEKRLAAIKAKADSGEMAYDQMLASGNTVGNTLVLDGVEGLVAQTRALEAVVAKLNLQIKVEGSDSLDNPSAVTSQ